jgi:hypothetical protein
VRISLKCHDSFKETQYFLLKLTPAVPGSLNKKAEEDATFFPLSGLTNSAQLAFKNCTACRYLYPASNFCGKLDSNQDKIVRVRNHALFNWCRFSIFCNGKLSTVDIQ